MFRCFVFDCVSAVLRDMLVLLKRYDCNYNKRRLLLLLILKMIGGGYPLYLKFWIKLTALERNRRFSISSLVTQP